MTDKADKKALVELAKAVLRDWQMEGGLVTAGTLKLAGEAARTAGR